MSSRQERVDRYAKAVWEVVIDRWTSALGEASKAVSGDPKLAALLADGYMKLNLIDLVLPCAVAYERTWTAVGVAGAWLLAAIALSWPIRGTIGRKAWRTLHYFTFVGWLMSLMHGIGAGTDIEVPAVYWGYVLSASTVAALLVYRIADARRRHATPARTASARAKRVQTT